MVDRKVYLNNATITDAAQQFMARLQPELTPEEIIPAADSRGRITSRPVYACRSVPHYYAAAMDGIAVRTADTCGATETAPLCLTILPEGPVSRGQARYVDTGDMMPPGTDAVIMLEDFHPVDEATVEITAAVAPWQHVRMIGEDIVVTEQVLPAGIRIRPVEIGALLAAGVTHVPVRRKPRIGIIPTGSELVPAEHTPAPGQIVDFNSPMLGALVEEWGGEAIKGPIIPDGLETIVAAITKAVRNCDIVVMNAGSSLGREDYTATAIARLGETVVHGVAMKPGKPVVLGVVDGKPVVGLPGYPVAAVLAAEIFVRPLIERLLGFLSVPDPSVGAVLTRRIVSATGLDEFVRVKLGRVEGRLVATPLPRGAGLINSLVQADGILTIPRFNEGVEAGREVTVRLLKPLAQVEAALVVNGSHDLAVDILADFLRRSSPPVPLAAAHVGSLGGILAVKNGEAHMAGIHLFDEVTGEFNLPYVRRMLPAGNGALLVTLAHRAQGLLVPRGNPKGIRDLADLAREDVVFINRQRGAGTRTLLDYKLKELGLEPSAIQGYNCEAYTHTAVAAAVAGGAADTGLGIMAAARALDLDFIPVAEERYDLLIAGSAAGDVRVARLLEVIATPAFRRAVEALGGYDLREAGRIVARL